MLPDLCSTPFPQHFIGFDLISFICPSRPSVKHIMTQCLWCHSLFNSCFSSCIQSVTNISLVVCGIGVDDDDENDDDDDANKKYEAMECRNKIVFSMLALTDNSMIRGVIYFSKKKSNFRINCL